jgi:hypothetical protein
LNRRRRDPAAPITGAGKLYPMLRSPSQAITGKRKTPDAIANFKVMVSGRPKR